MCSWCSFDPASTLARKKVDADALFLKREKSKQLEDQLNAAQAQRRTGWENLPEDELFTPAGFSEERAEATSYSNYSYWGSTFRAFFKNRIAVALLIALVFVVGFAFLQPYLPAHGRSQSLPGRLYHRYPVPQYRPRGRGLYLGFQRPSARTCGPASGPVHAPV